MKRLIALTAALLLGACGARTPDYPDEASRVAASSRGVSLMAEAPDGTKLWKWDIPSEPTVYFSGGGTQWTHKEGKVTTTDRVPAVNVGARLCAENGECFEASGDGNVSIAAVPR